MLMGPDLCYPDGVGPEQQGVLIITAQELDVGRLFLDAGMLGKAGTHPSPLPAAMLSKSCSSVQYTQSPADGAKRRPSDP